MKHIKLTALMIAIVAIVALAVLPTLAQDDSPADYPVNTISVTGTGSASGAPDVANMEIGVETFNADVSIAFTESNDKVTAVIDALVTLGVAPEDIRTSGLNIYLERYPRPDMMSMTEEAISGGEIQPVYMVNNQLRVTVRDISLVAAVMNTAVENGANNIYGLNFGIDDTTSLETEARAEAALNAQTRAEELAALAGGQLGEVIIISENFGGGFYNNFPNMAMNESGLGGGGAAIEPGQLSVTVQLNVTYRFNH